MTTVTIDPGEEGVVELYSVFQPFGTSVLSGASYLRANSTSAANRYNAGYTTQIPADETTMRAASELVITQGNTNPFIVFNETVDNKDTFNVWNDYFAIKTIPRSTRFYQIPSDPAVNAGDGCMADTSYGNVVTVVRNSTDGYRKPAVRFTNTTRHLPSIIDLEPRSGTFTRHISTVGPQGYVVTVNPADANQVVIYTSTDTNSPFLTSTVPAPGGATQISSVYAVEGQNGQVVLLCTYANLNECLWATWSPPATVLSSWSSVTFDQDSRYIGLIAGGGIVGIRHTGGDQTNAKISVYLTPTLQFTDIASFDNTLFYPRLSNGEMSYAPQSVRFSCVGVSRATISDPLEPCLFFIGGGIIAILDDAYPTNWSTFDMGSAITLDGFNIVTYGNNPSAPYNPVLRVYIGVAGTGPQAPTRVFNGLPQISEVFSMQFLNNSNNTASTPYVVLGGAPSATSYCILDNADLNPVGALTIPPATTLYDAYLFNDGSVRVLRKGDNVLQERSIGDNTLSIPDDSPDRVLIDFSGEAGQPTQAWVSSNGKYALRFDSTFGTFDISYWVVNDWPITFWTSIAASEAETATRYVDLTTASNMLCAYLRTLRTDAGNSDIWPWASCACYQNPYIMEQVFNDPSENEIYLSTAPCLWGACDGQTGVTEVGSLLQKVLEPLTCTSTALCIDDVKLDPDSPLLAQAVTVSAAACGGTGPTCAGQPCNGTCYLGKYCLPACTEGGGQCDNLSPSGQQCVENACLIPCTTANADTACPDNYTCNTTDRLCVLSSAEGDNSGLSIGAIIGIVVGVIVLIAVVACGAYFGTHTQVTDPMTGEKKWVSNDDLQQPPQISGSLPPEAVMPE